MNITTGKGDIRVAIVGVGNCANSLVQGVEYYKDAALDQEIPGLMHAVVGGYHISSIKFVAAFDVDAKKVGLDLADAIWASENNTIKFSDGRTNLAFNVISNDWKSGISKLLFPYWV